MKQKKRLLSILSVILLLVSVSRLSALEVTNGKMKLVIHENTGRFSLYYLEDVRKDLYTPLFLVQDPRTSVLSILVNNKVYRMGEAAEFVQSVEQTVQGARIVWKSPQLEVSEEFVFIKSKQAPLSDGISIVITLRNISEQDLTLGARYLIDTQLGEKSSTHFVLSDGREVKSELEITRPLPLYLISRADNLIGLQCMLSSEGITQPDRVVFANWKRMNDSSWSFESSQSRNFNLLPYSVNDSAVFFFYNPVSVSSGSSRTISMAMGNFSPDGFTTSGNVIADSAISTLYNQAVVTPSGTTDSLEVAVRTDLITVSDLIRQLDKKLSSDSAITEEEIVVYRQILEELRKRKAAYEGK